MADLGAPVRKFVPETSETDVDGHVRLRSSIALGLNGFSTLAE